MSDTELKPCPFCGGTDSEDNATQSAMLFVDRFRGAHGGMAIRVACRCGVMGKAADCVNRHPGHAEADAIAAWNRRAAVSAPSEIAGLVERLRHRVKFDTPVSPYKLLDEAAAALVAQQTEIERVRAERDDERELARLNREFLVNAQHRAGEQMGRAHAAEAKAADLLSVIDTIETNLHDEPIRDDTIMGLDRAREIVWAALSSVKPEGGERP